MKYDINDIMKMLPHRYPFLLIDRVESINEDKTVCVAIKNVTANEPQFTGHFPNCPVMPGVLIGTMWGDFSSGSSGRHFARPEHIVLFRWH